MKEEKKLNWFVSFLNKDLNAVTDTERLKTITDVAAVILGMINYITVGEKPDMPANRWGEEFTLEKTIERLLQPDKLEACQKILCDFFNSVMVKYSEAQKYTDKFRPGLYNYFSLADLNGLKAKVELPVIEIEPPKLVKSKFFTRLNRDSLANAPIQLAFRADSDEKTLLFYFIIFVERVPASAFRKCPWCDKFFIHLSKRIRTYCSQPCATANGSQRRRKSIVPGSEADKEHKRKERERSHDYYVLKKEKKLGKKVKVKRRPIKK